MRAAYALMAPTTCRGFSAAMAARSFAPAEAGAEGVFMMAAVYGRARILTTVRPVTLPSIYAGNAAGRSANGIVRVAMRARCRGAQSVAIRRHTSSRSARGVAD